jgi:hypothetical protein
VGSWGSSLYSGDFAADLRRTVAVVARLPFDAEKLIDLLVDVERASATNADDADHTVFWLVVADQLARRGVHSSRAREAALEIIDSGRDLELMARLGMPDRDRRRRSQNLAELRARLLSPAEVKRGRMLQRPQPFLWEPGEVLAFPTSRGECINPYFRNKSLITGGWSQDGWGAAIVVERGRAFDFLTWYRPLVASSVEQEKPVIDTIVARRHWRLDRPGTASRLHIARMEIEGIGRLNVDLTKLHARFAKLPTGVADAVNDVSIANRLRVGVTRPQRRQDPTIESVSELLA